MSDDFVFKMYEAQAELVETKQELERIRRENDELKNQMTANNLMKMVDDFQRKYSDTLEIIQEKLSTLTTALSNHDDTFAEIKETLKDLKEKSQVEKENEKSLDDRTKLSENVGKIQFNFTTLFMKVFSSEQLLSSMNGFFRIQNQTLKKQNEAIEALKKDMKTMGKETILLLGGKNASKMMDSLIVLQNNGEDDGNWKELNIKLPYAVNGHGAQFINNCLYIFGGENERKETLNSTYKLSISYKWYTLSSNLQWDKMADMNEQRDSISNSSVILNDRIWVIGGWNKKTLKSVEMYDPKTNIWTNKKEMNQCRTLAAAVVVHGKIFCCGDWNEKTRLSSAECYDPSSNVWTLISDMPGPNAGCGIVTMDAHLVVIGGKAHKGKDYLNSVWVLDTTDKNAKWIEREPRLSRPLCQFSIARIDDKIFVCGGLYTDQKDSKNHVTDNVEIFDGQVWRNGPKLMTSLRNSAAVVIPMDFARSLN